MKLPVLSPGRWLLAGAVACVAVVLLTVLGATRTPWLGLDLVSSTENEDKSVRIVAARGPSAGVPGGARLVSIAARGQAPIALEATDLIDEPDYFDRYADMDAFFAKQGAIVRALRSGDVVLEVARSDGTTESFAVTPAASRPVATLPTVFWFQVVAGSIGLLASLWVFVLRPRVTGVRMFALAGASILGFTAPAALYSTRELALDGALFQVLSALNHLYANLFGIGLVGIFLSFPNAIVKPRLLWALSGVFVLWWILDQTRIAPDQTWGARAPIMLEMLLAILFAGVQWRRAKGDPRARASLRWFGVCVLTGASFFVFTVVGTTIFGMFPPIPQGYSFGFFLMMHVGLALGLRQTRLFELSELAYVVLFWVVGAVALVALDAAVLLLLDTSRLVSSALSLFAVGLAYLPFRSWIWSKALARKKVDETQLFRGVLDVVFEIDHDKRAQRWTKLFEDVFVPLEIARGEVTGDQVGLADDGLRMTVPAVTTLPALRLSFPWRGRGLFGDRHVRLATALRDIAGHAEDARDAFDRGVREERARVARDLHDDLGAALTSALYQQQPDGIHQAVRSAILEMRSMVKQLTGSRVKLEDVVGDLRHEAQQRLGPAGIALEWPLVDFGGATVHCSVARNFTSVVREVTANVLKHSGAKTMQVDVLVADARIAMTAADDGNGFDTEQPSEGNGLRNLRRRAKDVGGTVAYTRRDRGTSVRLEMPFDPALGGTPVLISELEH